MKISIQRLATIVAITLPAMWTGRADLTFTRSCPGFHKIERWVAITYVSELTVESYDGTKVVPGTIASVDKDGFDFIANLDSGAGLELSRIIDYRRGSRKGRKTHVDFAKVRRIRPFLATIRIDLSPDNDATDRSHFLNCVVLKWSGEKKRRLLGPHFLKPTYSRIICPRFLCYAQMSGDGFLYL